MENSRYAIYRAAFGPKLASALLAIAIGGLYVGVRLMVGEPTAETWVSGFFIFALSLFSAVLFFEKCRYQAALYNSGDDRQCRFFRTYSGKILHYNEHAARLFNLPTNGGEPRVHVDQIRVDDGGNAAYIQAALNTGKLGANGLLQYKSVCTIDKPSRRIIGSTTGIFRPTGIEVVISDVTPTYVDSLTQCLKREFFDFWLDPKFNHRENKHITVTFIDLDGFKAINDNWGHAAGDQILRELGRRINGLIVDLRNFVVRMGGDEFIIVQSCNENEFSSEEILQAITSRSYRVRLMNNGVEHYQFIGVCASVARSSPAVITDYSGLETLLNESDHAMYANKVQRLDTRVRKDRRLMAREQAKQAVAE